LGLAALGLAARRAVDERARAAVARERRAITRRMARLARALR
jgi:hypothetical protein